MNLITKLWKNEAGSPTVESVFWIMIFVGTLASAVIIFGDKIVESIGISSDMIVADMYDDFCRSQEIGKNYWNRVPVPEGGTPVCVAVRPN